MKWIVQFALLIAFPAAFCDEENLEFHHVGCFADEGSERALPEDLGKQSPEKCVLLAAQKGYKAFGIQNGGECWSGPDAEKTYNKHGKKSDCKDGLGGALANDVYLIGKPLFSKCDCCTKYSKYLKAMDKKLNLIMYNMGIPYNKTAKNCEEILKLGKRKSGVYEVDPDGKGAFKVYCDQKTDGGGWTVFQKRRDGSVDFYRGWNDYKNGFGDLKGEFWLGLDKINRLTHQTRNRLHVDLQSFDGNSAYAEYDYFTVGSERSKYRLSLGAYSGTAGDSLSYHRGMAFSTKDRDNDVHYNDCAATFKGAWWYKKCHHSNLNGLYHHGKHTSFADGVNWYAWKGYRYSAKKAEMKIRPL